MARQVSYPRVRITGIKPGAIMGIRAQYEAAGNGERAQRSWKHAGSQSSRYLLGKSLDIIRRRCRYEVYNNPIAASLVDYIVDTTIAGGLRPRFADKDLAALWSMWVEEADADGDLDLYQLQALALRETIIGGEVFNRLRLRRPEDGLPVPLQVQVLPSEFVPLLDDDSKSIASGIRFDGIENRVEYLMHKRHPGDGATLAAYDDYSRVPAASVAHMMRKVAAGQLRGEPWLVRSIIRLHELDEYQDAELVKKNFASRISMILKKTGAPTSSAMLGPDDQAEAEEAEVIPSLRPGDNFVSPEGYDVEIPKAHESGAEYPVYIRQILREACAGLAPVELVMDDMQSPERALQLSLAKYGVMIEQRRKMVVRRFCQPVLWAFLQAAERSGKWRPAAGKTLDDYYYPTVWVGQPLPNIRPLQQAQADTERMRNGTLTHAQAVEQYGHDYAEHIERLAIEAADRDARGLILDGDPRRTAGSGTVQKPTEPEERDDAAQ